MTIENKLFDVHRARNHPVSNLSKSEHKTLHQLRTSKDIVIRLQDKGSRFVILDRTDYIDKVESDLSKTGIFAQRARVDQAVGLYYRKENLTF